MDESFKKEILIDLFENVPITEPGKQELLNTVYLQTVHSDHNTGPLEICLLLAAGADVNACFTSLWGNPNETCPLIFLSHRLMF